LKRAVLSIAVVCLLAGVANAQRFALLETAAEGAVPGFAERLTAELSKRSKLLDGELAFAAFRSVEIANPFNMSWEEASRVGEVIGCDRFVMLRSGLQRRAASGGRSYLEAFAVTYLVEARTGLLTRFDLTSTEAATEAEASAKLIAKVPEIAAKLSSTKPPEIPPYQIFPEPPPEGSPYAVGLKLPIPYKRIRPEYTVLAALYGVKATVDIEVSIDADGRVDSTRILRWAGFGLDEAVEQAVRSMNWRPAMRDGKSLPMRVLLRYNFRKVETDEEN